MAQELPFTFRIFDDPNTGQDVLSAPGVLTPAQFDMRYAAETPDPQLSSLGWRTATGAMLTGWSNYGSFVDRAEFRILSGGKVIAVLPAELGRSASYNGALPDGSHYVLRVYDGRGRFDETSPKGIVENAPAPGQILAAAAGNELDRQRIRLSGRAIVADGSGIGDGQQVLFAGQLVTVRADGRFENVQIVPEGSRVLNLVVINAQGQVLTTYRQPVDVTDEDNFRVGIADITFGRNNVSGPIASIAGVSGDRFSGDFYTNARLAFYVREHTRSGWKVTASADTGEGPVDQLFDNFMASDPNSFLRRLDPSTFYPVYGDDSTAVNDAPTDGKFYLHAERDGTSLLWGSFKTTPPETHFTNFSRALYGARLSFSGLSDAAGDNRVEAELFAAEPGTVQAQEEFRGVGGSIYFLRNRDVLRGSEQVWVEVRDTTTGVLISRTPLNAGQDYEVNAIQGRIQLTSPLASSLAGSGLVGGATGGDPQYLVMRYEYAPTVSATGDTVVGGTATIKAGERLTFGASVIDQQNGAADQTLGGLTARYEIGENSAFDLELARSNDAGVTAYRSLDGGFTFASVPGGAGTLANAARVALSLDLADAGLGQGHANLYWQNRDAGFSGPGSQTNEDVQQFGADIGVQMTARSDLRFILDSSDAASQTHHAAELNLGYQLSEPWTLGFGLKIDDLTTNIANASATLSGTGTRLDGVLRADYDPGLNWTAYGYAQGTLNATGTRARNDRAGLGGTYTVSDRFTLEGEVSGGTGGAGARIGATLQVDDRTQTYLSYTLTPDSADNQYPGATGEFTYGGSRRVNDNIYVLAEQTYLHGAGPTGVTNSFGLDISPNDAWVLGAQLEFGRLADPLTGDMERRAVSFSANYSHEKLGYNGVLEYRVDTSTTERTTLAFKNDLSYQVSDEWRFLGKLSALRSTSSDTAIADAEYLELVTGFAYRPVENDRLNALMRYTYLYDNGQNGSTVSLAQRSHVFSADAIYEINSVFSLGGKIGARVGEVRLPGNGWTSSDAILGVIRADVKLRPMWDILGEYRLLTSSGASARTGAVAGVYRRVNENMRVGLGYSAVNFSDDLTNQDYSSEGLFLNIVGKF
ncbi:MAG: hypothetical protein V3U96_09955 [Paracoccaceae bacterium]